MTMEHEGKVGLRTYIERMFDERTNSILTQVEMLDHKLMRERDHMDEMMRLHVEMHANEHHLTSSSMTRSEEAILTRLNEVSARLEKLSDDSSKFVRRDTVDDRFHYTNEHLSKIEQRLSALQSDINTVSSKRDAGVWVLGIIFTMVTILTSITSIVLK